MKKESKYTTPISGREYESKKLLNFINNSESELISIIGRRRVGKTFLIKRIYEKEMLFSMIGIKDASKTLQLKNFANVLNTAYGTNMQAVAPKNWIDAFELLKRYIKQKRNQEEEGYIFDELPWLASPRSGFLQAFDHFWNDWAVDQNLIVVICGSAATWMIENIINNKGGLHNRVTTRINLQPFTLKETEDYLKDRGIKMPRYDILKLYMALGGVPLLSKKY